MTADRERIKELVERSDLRYDAEVLDHIEQIEGNGLELTDREEWTPDPGTPAELVAWDFGLLYGYYLASEEIRDGGRLRPDGGTEVSDRYQDAIDVLEREIRGRGFPQDDALRLARRVLLAEDGRPDAPPVRTDGGNVTSVSGRLNQLEELQNKSSMDHWWPRLEPLDIPTPETIRLPIVDGREYQGGLTLPVPDEAELHGAVVAVEGPPAFLRTDVTSRKHEMKGTSLIEDTDNLLSNVSGVVQQHHLSMGMPMPSSFYVREWLDLWHLYKTFADSSTPLAAEMRLFLLDGEVYGGGFYWPKGATWGRSATEDNWPELWEQTKERAEDGHHILWEYAHRVAEEFDTGYWSVDFALTENERWYAIDMARGELSAHPESVEQAVPDPRNRSQDNGDSREADQ